MSCGLIFAGFFMLWLIQIFLSDMNHELRRLQREVKRAPRR